MQKWDFHKVQSCHQYFNIYLEDALNSSSILHSMRKRGDLLAFADDMLIMSN